MGWRSGLRMDDFLPVWAMSFLRHRKLWTYLCRCAKSCQVHLYFKYNMEVKYLHSYKQNYKICTFFVCFIEQFIAWRFLFTMGILARLSHFH